MRNGFVSDAIDFVSSVELPQAWRAKGITLDPINAKVYDFDKSKDQSVMVGSDVISFVRGVTEERRTDIVNSALLAQLVAKKKIPDQSRVFDWYTSYFNTLSSIGWVIQDRQFVEHKHASKNFAAHEAILSVATSLLGPATAAFQVVKATLDALRSMKENSPFITLFNRESQHANTARFQFSIAEEDVSGQFLLTLMAFALSANSELTQVLFLKFGNNDVEIKHASGKITINTDVLNAIREAVRDRIVEFSNEYIKSIPALG